MNTQTQAFTPDQSVAAFDDVAVSPKILAIVMAALFGGLGAVALAALSGFGIWGLVGSYIVGNFGVGSLLLIYLGTR
ncbi:hypothetical protein [Roseicyclus mahoneyensis]|uniref:Uncharacterized protein n=1 Tax=Roseicyclus mahoneyensis TaxID=164332 RepID=A0A316H3N5_9RHOB|nr:hypothetical protein [Roseicyclus mahoneyensis]PWK62133.1 hypothetical protein C7455_101159 [Roseicyclus mahoneyensis]